MSQLAIDQALLKTLPDSLILALTDASLASGYFPSPMKEATAIFIPKPQKSPTDLNNYRPISLLETLGKVFERLINHRLRHHLEHRNLLTDKEFN